MKITIKDVAHNANVSVATVSRILNGQPGYTEETKQAVLSVVNQLGYTPNAIARGLVTKTNATFGVLLPSLTSNFMFMLLNGVVSAAREKNYSVIICHTGEDGKDTLKYLTVLAEQRVSGVMFASELVKEEYLARVFAMNIPVVLVSTICERYLIPYIKVDDKSAAYHATKYLIERGHRKIGMISGTKDDVIAGIPRVEGFKQALKDAGIVFWEKNLAYGDFAYSSGIAAMQALLRQAPDITAIFAASDEMAVGALTYAYQQGIHVPDQISIMGYDDTQLAEMAIPPLTSVHQPIYEMGERAVDMLIEKKGAGESIIMPFRITERDSVRTL